MTYEVLTDTAIAEVYVNHGGGVFTADRLIGWLNGQGLSHRNAGSIAQAINEIQRRNAAESANWQANVREGTTASDRDLRAMDDLALAGQVAQMTIAEYAQNRAQLGAHKDTMSFLGGN
jgi:hypothetical protein